MGIFYNNTNIPTSSNIYLNNQSANIVRFNNEVVWKKRIYIYKNGVVDQGLTGPWAVIGAGHPDGGSNVIATPYGTPPSTAYDRNGILYIEGNSSCCGGMRTSYWIPWANWAGMTCHCKATIFAKPWGYADGKFNRYIPYIDCAIWTASEGSLGSTIYGRSAPFAGYGGVPPLDANGKQFDGYVAYSDFYRWDLDLTFTCPSHSGWLFFTMSHGVPCYGQIRTAEIYIE